MANADRSYQRDADVPEDEHGSAAHQGRALGLGLAIGEYSRVSFVHGSRDAHAAFIDWLTAC